jgi:predicted hydrolase (HD superfamily)
MKGVAKKFGLNQDNYYYIGLLHDIDLEEVGTDMTIHALTGGAWLKNLGLNEVAVDAIISHNAEGNGSKRRTFLDFVLTCSESLTGLISANCKGLSR